MQVKVLLRKQGASKGSSAYEIWVYLPHLESFIILKDSQRVFSPRSPDLMRGRGEAAYRELSRQFYHELKSRTDHWPVRDFKKLPKIIGCTKDTYEEGEATDRQQRGTRRERRKKL